MSPSAVLQPRADDLTKLIAGIRPEQLDAPTPCDDWTVRDLLNHLVGAAHMFGGAFAGQAPAGGDGRDAGDLVGDDPVAAWAAAVQVIASGLDTPGALEREIPMPFGPTPGTIVFEILKFDTLVHAWDLATATGQPFDPPADVVEEAIGVAQLLIAPEMRNGQVFAAEVTAPQGATPIQRLAAFTGRTV